LSYRYFFISPSIPLKSSGISAQVILLSINLAKKRRDFCSSDSSFHQSRQKTAGFLLK